MNREQIARAERRQSAVDALDYERDREAALKTRLEHVIAELEGWRVDQAVFGLMAPEDVAALRAGDFAATQPDDWARVEFEDDLRDLERELEECSRQRQALERYVEAIDKNPAVEPAAPRTVDTVG